MIVPVLTTPRLTVRPFEPGDFEALGTLPDPRPPDQRSPWLEWTVLAYQQLAALYQPPYGDRAVVRTADGALIGAVGLVPTLIPLARTPGGRPFGAHRLPEIGMYWALTEGARGQGYATEAAWALMDWAVQELVLARIVATTTFDNPASIRVMERLGMTVLLNDTGEPPWLQVVGVLER